MFKKIMAQIQKIKMIRNSTTKIIRPFAACHVESQSNGKKPAGESSSPNFFH